MGRRYKAVSYTHLDVYKRQAHMIDNPDTKIRIEAAKALGSIGTEYAKTYLLHRLNAEQDETVKTAIKEALHTLAEHH